MSTNKILIRIGLGLLIIPQFAFSQGASSNFCDATNELTNLTSGGFSQVIALSMLLMGIAMGITKNTMIPAVAGIMAAIFFNVGPRMINETMIPPECKKPIIQKQINKPAHPELIAKKEKAEDKKESVKSTIPEKQVVQGMENWTY